MGHWTIYSWYRTTFDVPSEWTPGNRVLLNFGAVDYETTVFVNGKNVTKHTGGYWAFNVDITDQLSKNETNELWVNALHSRLHTELTLDAGLCLYTIQLTLRQTTFRLESKN